MTSKNIAFFVGIKAFVTIIVGMIFIFNPLGLIRFLSHILGITLLIIGGINFYKSYTTKNEVTYWGWLVKDGIVQSAFGAVFLLWPMLTPQAITIILGFWFVSEGAIQFVIGNKYNSHRWKRNLLGLMIAIFGGYIIFNPLSGIGLITTIFGSISLAYGGYMIFLLISHQKNVTPETTSIKEG